MGRWASLVYLSRDGGRGVVEGVARIDLESGLVGRHVESEANRVNDM